LPSSSISGRPGSRPTSPHAERFNQFAVRILWATALTGIIGEAIKKLIEKTVFRGAPKAQIEDLFGRLDLIAPALAAAGILILIAGIYEHRKLANFIPGRAIDRFLGLGTVTFGQSTWMGIVQGLALPFRGFSRSGTTISAGMLVGAAKERAERFSFAMAVVLTPAVVGLEALRLEKAHSAAVTAGTPMDLHGSVVASLLGMVFSFLAGLVALKWLSSWLENGRWYLFGIYCILASGVVFYLHTKGF
jgi:undecaprenyl-diphosphatase